MFEALVRLLDAVAPRACAGCGRVAGDDLCPACVDRLLGQALPSPRRLGDWTLRAAFLFTGPARRAVHAGKYRGRRRAVALLAAVAAERLAPALVASAPHPVAVVPVPLACRRRRTRGYNQSEAAAAVLARLPFGGPLDLRLARRRETRPQVGRAFGQRAANVAGAFEWRGGPLPAAEPVWLVDDVATTGATLCAAARPLQQAGARRIEFVALCGVP